MTRIRDLVGFAGVTLTTVVYLYVTLPASAKAMVLTPPPQEQPEPKPDRAPPLQPGDEIIMDPDAYRPSLNPLSKDWKERRKDPRSWA